MTENMIHQTDYLLEETNRGKLDFISIKKDFLEDYYFLRQSVDKNIIHYRKYLTFFKEDRFPTNLFLRRGLIQYSSAWSDKEKTALHNAEEAILQTARQDMMTVRSNAYYDMVIIQIQQIKTLLNKDNIKKYFFDKNPEMDYNNSDDTTTREFNTLLQEVYEVFPILGFTPEEHIQHIRQMKSIPTNSTSKRTREESTTEHNSETNDAPPNKLRSVDVRPTSPPIITTLHSTSFLDSTSSSSSSSTATIPTILRDSSFVITSPNHNPIKSKKVNKVKKIITNNKTPAVFDLSKTSTSTHKPKTNDKHTNIKTITDQLSSLNKTVELFISANNNIKNGKYPNGKIIKKNVTSNSPFIINTKEIQTKNQYMTKGYNQNQTPLYTPPPFQHIAPALNLQPQLFTTQQTQYQQHSFPYPHQPSNYHYNNNRDRDQSNHSVQHINNQKKPHYEGRSHPQRYPYHG